MYFNGGSKYATSKYVCHGDDMKQCLTMFSLYLCRGEEDESLAIKPPQQIARKDKSHHRKEEKRKDKRRHRSHSAEGGVGSAA